MTINEKKKYLRQYRGLLREERQLKEEIERVKASALPHSLGISPAPGGSGTEHDLSDWASKWDRLERELEAAKEKAADARIRIERELQRMEEAQERNVLRDHYVKGRSLERIARDTHFSNRQIWRIHKSALQNFDPENTPGV